MNDRIAEIKARCETLKHSNGYVEIRRSMGAMSELAQRDIPYLLAEVERLRAVIAGVKGYCKGGEAPMRIRHDPDSGCSDCPFLREDSAETDWCWLRPMLDLDLLAPKAPEGCELRKGDIVISRQPSGNTGEFGSEAE
jgi:hypothetical protein